MQSDQHIEHFVAILRRQGHRITPVVKGILKNLYDCGQVKNAQQIREDISCELGHSIGYPTVYRILERLLQSGVICCMHNPDGIMRYYLCRNPRPEHHHHFICTNCMKVLEIDLCISEQLETFVRDNLNARLVNHIFQIDGLCEKCK